MQKNSGSDPELFSSHFHQQVVQRAGIDRLREVVVEAGFHRAPAVALLPPAGERDQRDVAAAALADGARDLEAEADRLAGGAADDDFEAVESRQEAESEIGMAEWIDPDTGVPAEDNVPRIEDH